MRCRGTVAYVERTESSRQVKGWGEAVSELALKQPVEISGKGENRRRRKPTVSRAGYRQQPVSVECLLWAGIRVVTRRQGLSSLL